MSEQTWIDSRVDRANWGAGDWENEPDKVQWTDEATGLVCLAKRHPRAGNWCGYVGVPPGHPWHGKGYDDVDVDDVHGGLTYADSCEEGPPEQSICHVTEPGQPEHLWWFGFDCHHAWDMAPGSRDVYIGLEQIYRPLSYVRGICRALARQIAQAAT